MRLACGLYTLSELLTKSMKSSESKIIQQSKQRTTDQWMNQQIHYLIWLDHSLASNDTSPPLRYYHEDNEGCTANHFEAAKAKMEHIANLKNLNFKENSIAANVNMIKKAIQSEADEQFLQR